MKKVKLIIELPNGTVYGVKKKDRFTWTTLDELKEAIKKGKPLQAEFEEIKAEIDKLEMFYLYSNDDLISKKEVFEIIDNRIKELKGE